MYSMYTTLWSGYHYYSKFIDKEMRNREIKWLSQGYTVYQLGVSREIQPKGFILRNWIKELWRLASLKSTGPASSLEPQARAVEAILSLKFVRLVVRLDTQAGFLYYKS